VQPEHSTLFRALVTGRCRRRLQSAQRHTCPRLLLLLPRSLQGHTCPVTRVSPLSSPCPSTSTTSTTTTTVSTDPARPAANRERNGTAHPSGTDVHFRGARIHPDAGGHRGRVGSASSCSKQEDPRRFQGSLERNHAGLQSTQDIGRVGGCSILVQQVCNPRCRQFQCRALGFFFSFFSEGQCSGLVCPPCYVLLLLRPTEHVRTPCTSVWCTPIRRNGTEEHPGHGWASEGGVVENMARTYCILLHISLDGAESDEDPANRQVQRAVEVAQQTDDGDGNHYRGICRKAVVVRTLSTGK
jgi:hypothetical protein